MDIAVQRPAIDLEVGYQQAQEKDEKERAIALLEEVSNEGEQAQAYVVDPAAEKRSV